MPEKSAQAQRVQFGAESTMGTSVAADKELPGWAVTPGVKYESKTSRGSGYAYPSLVVPNKDWTEAGLEIVPTYDEMAYAWASILKTPSPAQQGATSAYLWTFDPSSHGGDTVQTYTVEHGDTNAARKWTYGMVNQLTFEVGGEISASGNMIGQDLDANGVSLTAGPTEISQVPMLRNQFDLYMDDTWADLGTTKLTRSFTGTFEISRYGQVWPIDSSESSWAAHVENSDGVDATFTLMLAADSTGEGLLTTMRAGTTKYLRLEADGGEADTGYDYRQTIDMACKIEDVADYSDEDGVYAMEFTFRIVHDATASKAVQVELMNTLTAL